MSRRTLETQHILPKRSSLKPTAHRTNSPIRELVAESPPGCEDSVAPREYNERRACEIGLRAERKTGQILQTMAKSKERQAKVENLKQGPKSRDTTSGRVAAPISLKELGISRDQSSKWQKLAFSKWDRNLTSNAVLDELPQPGDAHPIAGGTMRFAAILLSLCFAAGTVAASLAQSKGVDRKGEAEEYLLPWPIDAGANSYGAKICEGDQKQFVREYPKAFEGDYESERNVANCLESGCSGALRKNPIQACAWRMVLVTSGSPKVNDLDAANLKIACGRLAEEERQAAAQRAAVITAEIQSGKARR